MVFTFSVLSFFQQETCKIHVTVSGIRNELGSIKVALYKNEESYRKEDPFLIRSIAKNTAEKGEMTFSIPVEPGKYAIVILDDENNNDKMDFRFFIPKEGYGFSNYDGIRKPSFDDMSIEVNRPLSISIRLSYL